MRICGLSDTHGIDFTIPECDVFCLCGDWSPLDIQRDMVAMQRWMDTFIRFLCDLPCKHVLVVAGNHDFIMQSYVGISIFENTQQRLGLLKTETCADGSIRTVFKVKYLDRCSVTLDGVTFWGSPVIKQINRFYKLWAFEDNQPTYDIPENVDVVLTHQPSSYGGLGDSYYGDSQRSSRYGVKSLTDAVRASNAKLHLCGHVHTGNHTGVHYRNASKTLGCNVSYLDEEYEVSGAPSLFNLDIEGCSRIV